MIDDDFIADPYAAYEILRKSGPLHWSDDFFGGAWLVSNYVDIANVLRDPRFSTQRSGRWINRSGAEARSELREFKNIFSRSLMFLDGAHHMRVRKVMMAGFKPEALATYAERIKKVVARLIAEFETSDEIDLIRDFARPLPALAIADMLSIDSADHSEFISWSDDIANFIGSPIPSLDCARAAQRSLVAMSEYFRAILPHRRRHPGDDLISLLIAAEATGGIVTTKELLAQCCTMLFAGHETSRHLIGNGLYHLIKNVEERQRLKSDPTMIPSALKEFLRFESPVQLTGRILKEDIDFCGQRLRRGELIIPLIGAGNRDPEKFSQPNCLDLRRNEGPHLAFGMGAHACIGASLTYLESEIAFSALIPLIDQMELLDSTPAWGRNPVYRGLTQMPIRLIKRKTSSSNNCAEHFFA